jgi:hypothetical protein
MAAEQVRGPVMSTTFTSSTCDACGKVEHGSYPDNWWRLQVKQPVILAVDLCSVACLATWAQKQEQP